MLMMKFRVILMILMVPELSRGDMAWAFQSFVEDLLQGEVFGSAACRHFGDLSGSSKNQVIEYYIHHFSPLFIQTLDEEAFLSGEKATDSRMAQHLTVCEMTLSGP